MTSLVLATQTLVGRMLPNARAREMVTFLMVGGTAFVVDFGFYNLLTLLGLGVLTSKCVSILLSVAVAYLGSRYFTFASQRATNVLREIVSFVLANAVGGGVALACLGFTHYVLGLTDPVIDNISGNFVGVLLGTVARYVLYKSFVFQRSNRTAVSK
jgi:putative flippase GtrA